MKRYHYTTDFEYEYPEYRDMNPSDYKKLRMELVLTDDMCSWNDDDDDYTSFGSMYSVWVL